MDTTPDYRHHDAARLWRLLYGDASGYLALFSGRRKPNNGQLTNPSTAYFRYPREETSAVRFATTADGRGEEVLFCTHLLTRMRRVKESAGSVTALWADYDGAPGGDDGPSGDIPQPSARVRSSGTGVHLYWRLTRSLSPHTAEELNRGLAHTIGADTSGWPLTKLLRVPGTRNHKYDEAPLVTLEILDPGAVYHPREIELLAAEDDRRIPPRENPRTPAVGHGSGGVPTRLSARIQELIEGGNTAAGKPYKSRSEADFAVCIAMFGAGYEEADVWDVLTDPSNGISERYRARGRHGPSYLVATITKARTRATPSRAVA